MEDLPDYLREFDDTAKTRQLIYDGCLEAVKNRFPVEDDTYRLELTDVHYDGPMDYSLEQQKQALLKSKNLRTPIRGKWRLIHKPSNTVLDEREDTVLQVPYYTNRGTVINNGNDYSIISQMRLRPGVYARRKRTGELETHFNIKPGTGRGFRFDMDPSTGVFSLTVGQSHVPLYPLLKGIGVTDQELTKSWGADIVAANAKRTDAQALQKTYRRMAGAKADINASPIAMGDYIKDAISKYEVDPEIVARTMGIETDHLTPELLIRGAQKLLDINRGDAKPDNRDNPRYTKVYAIEDLMRERIDKDAGRLSKNLLFRIKRDGSLRRLPKNALNPYLDSFIVGSGLTMPGEEANPLSNLEQMTRMTRFGEGGIRSEAAVTAEARDVNGDWLGFVDPIQGPEGCNEPDTEVFTEKGWMRWDQVTEDTKFACLINGQLCFHKPEALHVYDYDGLLYCAKSQLVSYRVTKNHRLWTRTRAGSYQFSYACDQKGRRNLLVGGHEPYEGSHITTITLPKPGNAKNCKIVKAIDVNDFAALLGWFISEGHVDRYNNRYRTCISQDKGEKADEIEALLDRLPFKYTKIAKDDVAYRFEINNKQLTCYLEKLGKAYEKHIPEEAFEYPPDARHALLAAMCHGDGRKQRSGLYEYCTVSHQLALDFERLAFSLGYSSRIGKEFSKNARDQLLWIVRLHTNKERQVTEKDRFTKPYKGKVYCATVPGGLMYCRYDDYGAHWTGNSKIGVDVRASYRTFKGKDNKLYGEFTNARNGKTEYVDIGTAADRVVAFPGQDMNQPYVYAMKDDVPTKVPTDTVDYIVPSFAHMMGSNTNMNPMPTAVQGGRQFYGSKFWAQYLPQVKGQVPLVDNLMPDGKTTFSEYYGRRIGTLSSPVDGTVAAVNDNSIVVKDALGKKHTTELVNNLPFNRLSAISYMPAVQVGQDVKAGDMIANSNYTDAKTGAINMGQNLKVAIAPYLGASFEDAHVISESAAKRLATDRLYSDEVETRNGVTANKNKYIAAFPQKFTKQQFETLDDDGLVKVGTEVHKGDPLIVAIGPKVLSSTDAQLGKLSKTLRNAFVDKAEVWEHDWPGVVTDTAMTSRGARVNIKSTPPVTIGDKLSPRFGLKGVVGCYDDQTEVFTDHGWVPWPEVTEDHQFACLIDGKPEFNKAEKLLEYDYDGEMLSATSECLDYCVTPNHRMWCRIEHYRGHSAKYSIRTAEDIYTKKVIHTCAVKFDLPNEYGEIFDITEHTDYDPVHERKKSKTKFATDDVAEFLGWYLSEGNLAYYHGTGIGKKSSEVFTYKVQITQKDGIHDYECKRIENLLTRMGVRWYKHNAQYTFSSKPWYYFLKQFGTCGDKYIPDFCWKFGTNALEKMFDAFMLGDGHEIELSTTRNGFVYYTNSERLAEDILRLGTLLGYAGEISKEYREQYGTIKYRVRFKARTEVGQSSAKFSRNQYTGKVYCATVPGGLVLVRRNRYPMWCGNSILPDDKMPRDAATNEPYDMIVNPMGFLSRVAPGQIMEVALGKVAHATGKQVRIPSLPPPEGWAIWTKKQLDAAGLKDSTDVFDPETGKTIKGVGDGYMFVSAFHHLAEKKASARGAESSYTQDEQPAKGGYEGAKRMCFVAEQEIRVLHGEESIGHICDKKIPALVWTELTPGHWGYSQITDWFVRKGKLSDVISIQVNGLPIGSTTVSRRNVMYGRKVLRCTKEHIIYTPDRGGVKAGDLKVGDFVSSYGYVPTKDQMSLLYGSMLGDGCISNINNEYIPRFSEEHSHHQANYVNWKIASLGNLVSSRKSTCSKSISGFGPKGTRCNFYTVHRADIAIKLRDEFYKKDGEFCSKHIGNIDLDSLTDVAIVAWFLDDGCISEPKKDPGHLSGSIATNSFSIEDVDRLVEWLNKRLGERFYRYEIHGHYKGADRTYQTIRMSTKACYKMAEIVAKYIRSDDIPETKKWLRKRVEELNDTYVGVDTAYTLGTVPVIISSIEPYSDGKHGPDDDICLYDITVAGCHRYCASDVLVSNSGLDLYALLAHGATDVVKDYITVRGTRNEQYWNALRLGLPIPEPGVPFIYDKFLNTLKAGGINVVEKGNITKILPLTDKDIDKLAGTRLITSSAMVDGDLDPVKGGLFDPGKTGGTAGNFWSAIPLPEPVPNPIMEEPIRRVLGLTVKQMEDVLSGAEQLDGKTGGQALKDALSKIDVDKKISECRHDIKTRRGSQRDNAIKVLGYLTSMKEQELSPQDWMINKVPVIPPKFRPASKLGDVVMVADLNDLYKEVIENANLFKDMHKDLPDSATTEERLNLYKSVKAAYGLGESITPEGQAKGLKGAVRQIIGTSPKFGMFQRKVISKTVDTVSRGVVTPDPNLDMDQVGIPEESAWQMYRPFVMRALVRRGYPPTTAIRMLDDKDKTAREMLEKEMETRPVLMDRAPTWHKFNIMAFKPHIVDGNTVRVCPLIVSGFNMDFNGDSLLNPLVFACIEGKLVVDYMSEIVTRLVPDYTEEKAIEMFGKTTTFLRLKENSMQILGLNQDGTTGFVDVEDISIHTSHGPHCYHVVTRGGLDGVFTAHHNFWGFDDNCNMVPVKTTDVGVGSLVPYASSFSVPPYEGQDNPPNNIPETFETGFWFGHYLGDGALTGRDDTISQASTDSSLLDYLENIGTAFIGVDAWREKNGYSVRWTSKKWFNWINQYGHGASGKRIPAWMLCSNKEFRKGLLAGYLAAEGAVSTGEFVVECISRELLVQFKFLAQSLGCICRLHHGRDERKSEKTGAVLHETWILYINTSTVSDLGITWPDNKKSQKFANAKVPTRRNFDVVPFPKCIQEICKQQGKILQTLRGEKRAQLISDTTVKVESKQYAISKKNGYCTRSFAHNIAIAFGLDKLDNDSARTWVKLINNNTIRWDVIEKYEDTTRPDVTYDMCVPGMQAFAVDGAYLTHNTVNFHVPVSDKAVKQANEKMMPSENLISLTDLQSARHPISKEQILGLFNLTQPLTNKPVKVFRNKEEAKRAYANGEIGMNDPIEVMS